MKKVLRQSTLVGTVFCSIGFTSQLGLTGPLSPTLGPSPELSSGQPQITESTAALGASVSLPPAGEMDFRFELLQLMEQLKSASPVITSLDEAALAGSNAENDLEVALTEERVAQASSRTGARSSSSRGRRKPNPSLKAKSSSKSSDSAAVQSAARPTRSAQRTSQDEARARQAVRQGDYHLASQLFFSLLEKERDPVRLNQLRFILGRTLQQLELNQISTFPFYEIIKTEGQRNAKSTYVRQSLERLTVAADRLESDVLLSYALKQISEEDFPAANRDLLYFRRGELRMREKNFIEAAREFSRVRLDSAYYWKSRYRLALALVEAGQLEKAETVFSAIVASNTDLTKTQGITNKIRVNALLGKARTLYQRKLFSEAIDAYREIPRDTEQWHDALFESTWAMLLDGRFRSALSNFHSLHSPFYEDFYQPESLLLRSIVYHYICRYDEMEKVLNLFDRTYPVAKEDLRRVLARGVSPGQLYKEIRKVDEQYDELRKVVDKKLLIPFLISRQILREGDVRRSLAYVRNLEQERARIQSSPKAWRDSRVGRYAARVIERRLDSTQVATGRLVRKHLERIQVELADHIEQTGLIRLDMLAGRKEQVKKEIAGKGLLREQIEDEADRNFYVQNGYDYWPFRGEFWLNEIGQYQYLGVKACE